MRKIEPGEELFVSYGFSYWQWFYDKSIEEFKRTGSLDFMNKWNKDDHIIDYIVLPGYFGLKDAKKSLLSQLGPILENVD